MTATPPPLPSSARSVDSTTTTALTVLMWVAWLGVLAAADFLGFLMFAFADAPGSAGAVERMIVPVFVWFGITFVAGVILLIVKRWWSIVLAFLLAISPPFVVFAGYNVFDGSATSTRAGPATAPAPPPVRVTAPPGGFRPTIPVREQPDFQSRIPRPTTRESSATTKP